MISDRKLNEKENKAIREKALYIETHSHVILKKEYLEGEPFTNSFLSFLLSEDEKITDINIPDIVNIKDYVSSMKIIFNLCEYLMTMPLTDNEKSEFRDKLRKYTKYFTPTSGKDLIQSGSLVSIDYNGYQKVKSNRKTSSK